MQPACHYNVNPDPAESFLETKKKCENFTIGEVAKPRSRRKMLDPDPKHWSFN
jgi:hypothetical protein